MTKNIFFPENFKLWIWILWPTHKKSTWQYILWWCFHTMHIKSHDKTLINVFSLCHLIACFHQWINLAIIHIQAHNAIYFHPHSLTHTIHVVTSDINNFSHHKTSPKHEFDLWNQKHSVISLAQGFICWLKLHYFLLYSPAHSYTHSIILPWLLFHRGELIGKNLPHIVMLLIKTRSGIKI